MGFLWSNRSRVWVWSLAFACLVFIAWFLLFSKESSANELAVKAGNRVVLAYKMSKITGTSDWLDRMETEHLGIKALPLEARLEFYTVILTECELFAATSLHFAEMVGDDSAALERHLKGFVRLRSFAELDPERQRRVRFWSEHLVEPR
jgi:hypothetical protein